MRLETLHRLLGTDPKETVESDQACLALSSAAEEVARYLARNIDQRLEILSAYPGDLFVDLAGYWSILSSSYDPSSSSATRTACTSSEDSRIALSLALAKLERNGVAGYQELQLRAAAHEGYIRRLIFNLTTFVRIEDPNFFTLHAVLTQLLSNIISPSSSPQPGADQDQLADRYLRLYLSGGRDEDVIIRLLDSRDAPTNTATLRLLNNLIRASPVRLRFLLEDPGVRWCAKILGRMDGWLEEHNGIFELGCTIFNSMIDNSLHPLLFAKLADSAEPLTPSQTTLLKILDSHLSSSSSFASSSSALPSGSSGSAVGTATSPTPSSPNTFLVRLYNTLSLYALSSMQQGKDDPRLPKVFEGLVLLAEALSSIGLRVQAEKDRRLADPASGGGEDKGTEEELELELVKMMKGDQGVVRPTVRLLKALSDFFPRLKPSPGSVSATPTEETEPAPFINLKRDLVKLLGVLSFNDTSVGDAVREEGGIQLILGMTELDERNPYLREHALFCIRNLMLNNPANQAIIGQMDPVGVLSESGEVLPVPEKMKRASVGSSSGAGKINEE